jgi:putative ABC transport system permease protein
VRKIRPAVMALFGGVGLVLLIACANMAKLLLSRGRVRQREIALRSALGAARGRVIRQLLTESILLSLVGGAAGLALGWAGTHWLLTLRPKSLAALETVSFDFDVLGYAFLPFAHRRDSVWSRAGYGLLAHRPDGNLHRQRPRR